ncbi:Ig-like domain-containing domain [Pseudaminobacter sp. NGMCC 1.201702]|uniref:Ig-like domain-containing protein n=1 Tax=Pseudaminobacter sp. NGMCC 1.201702 TaxID=3391825 RepID=UPI0039F0D46F
MLSELTIPLVPLCCGTWLAVAQFAPISPVSLAPFDGETDVHPGREIRIKFNRPVKAGDFDGGSVTLLDARNLPVAKSLHIEDEYVLVVRPQEPLRWSSRYEICVAASVDFPFATDGDHCSRFTVGDGPAPVASSNAPILIVSGKDNPFGAYYAEILKAEGQNSFTRTTAGNLRPDVLAHRDVVLLATSDVSLSDRAALEDWVRAGGSLIAMRPGPELLPLMGLKQVGAPVLQAYLKADSTLAASKGIVSEPIQIHGAADIYESRGTEGPSLTEDAQPQAVAQLHAGPTEPLPYPAITLRRVGQGHAVAFSFDLARSVAHLRQGNPDWAGEERDGFPPRRPNELFYPDYLNLDTVGIPQADEQQRLLANLIAVTARTPLPRFWYLPDKRRAAIIMAGDDHQTKGGTAGLFAKLSDMSPPDCSLDRWNCPRATAYLAPGTKFARGEAKKFHDLGFEIGVHIDTVCQNQENMLLARTIGFQLGQFRAKYGVLPKQETQRIHCIVWNGWVDVPRLEREHGIRFDLNYYYWPPSWIKGRPGFMTGSGFPMPFVDQNGNVLDIYQAGTQLVNENGVPQSEGVAFMLARALGPEQFFGVFGTHYDFADGFADILIREARRQGVALISAAQMLSWLDGRNGSQFDNIQWKNSTLTFTLRIGRGAEAAYAMLPSRFQNQQMEAVVCGSEQLAYSIEQIKGLEFAFFPARSGTCQAIYEADTAQLE